jgi:rhodanese-related sulfurtransferase
MTPTLIFLKPAEAAERMAEGTAVLIDVREPDEFARRRIPGAVSRPLSKLKGEGPPLAPGKAVVFTCLSGARTVTHFDRLARSAQGPAYVLQGGLKAWAAAGLPVEENAKAPIELMRQVQIAAGLLVLAGLALGLDVHPAFFGISAFVGAGLTFAGITGFCGMARLLALAPWNARPARRG